jgi:hypothetical protein
MKHSVQLFFITSLCIAANRSVAMELETPNKNSKEKKAKILTEITCIKDPFTAHYLTENRILINGKNGCSIVDPTTNTEIKRIFDSTGWASQIALHPHKTKFALSAYHYPSNHTHPNDARQKITIYNTQTYEVEHTIDWDHATTESMCFSPLDDTLAVCESDINVILYNYKKNTTTIINVPEAKNESQTHGNYYSPIFAFHPTQPFICLAWQTAYIHDLTTSTNKAMTKTSEYHTFCEYSSDGSFIALGTNYKINCIKPDQLPHFTAATRIYSNFDAKNDLDAFFGMAIHPNGNVLVTLARSTYRASNIFDLLQYWDINTKKCIATKNLRLISRDYSSPISISSSGNTLLIVMNNTCFEFKIPFKVIYQDITKKEFPFLLFLLKNYTNSCTDVEIPQDIYLVMRNTLLETYKRR